MDLRACFIGIALLVASVGSTALTLGRVRGVAIVGQSLDLSIQVQLDADESPSSLCIEADVFHADSRQDANRVRVTVEPAQQALTADVRILSSTYVDEPVVTIYLKAGCTQKSTRKYVLLADYASEPAVATAPASLPLVSAGAGSVSAADVASASASPVAPVPRIVSPASNRANERASSAASRNATELVDANPKKRPSTSSEPVKASNPRPRAAQAEGPAPASADKTTEKPKDVAAAPATGQARLKLDPLVMLTERVASLETSTITPARELTKESQKLQSLEGDVKALLVLAAKNEAALMEMRLRLQKAEAERLPAEWVYALTALVVAILGLATYLMTRRRGNSPVLGHNDWWSASKGAPLSPAGAVVGAPVSIPADLVGASNRAQTDVPPVTVGLHRSAPPPVQSARPILDDDRASEMDVSLVEMSPSNFDNLMQSSESHSALRRGPLPVPVEARRSALQPAGESRSINSEELFDIRQQAEFFVSLGQTDQAVRILENRINEEGETSPLIYLDLLKIFHSLGLKTDFRQFREDCNLLFNAKVPEFDSFTEEGKGIEGYPHVLAHVIALWGTPKASMVIEASIFRDPWDDKSPPFDLAAFRDLLLLHAIAQTAGQPLVTARPGSRDGQAAVVSGSDAVSRSAVDSAEQRAASAVDLNLSMFAELDLDLNAQSRLAAASADPGEADPDFPALITGEGAGSKNLAPQVIAGDLLDFSLPESGPGSIKKTNH